MRIFYSICGLVFVLAGAYKGDNILIALGVLVGCITVMTGEVLTAIEKKK